MKNKKSNLLGIKLTTAWMSGTGAITTAVTENVNFEKIISIYYQSCLGCSFTGI